MDKLEGINFLFKVLGIETKRARDEWIAAFERRTTPLPDPITIEKVAFYYMARADLCESGAELVRKAKWDGEVQGLVDDATDRALQGDRAKQLEHDWLRSLLEEIRAARRVCPEGREFDALDWMAFRRLDANTRARLVAFANDSVDPGPVCGCSDDAKVARIYERDLLGCVRCGAAFSAKAFHESGKKREVFRLNATRKENVGATAEMMRDKAQREMRQIATDSAPWQAVQQFAERVPVGSEWRLRSCVFKVVGHGFSLDEHEPFAEAREGRLQDKHRLYPAWFEKAQRVEPPCVSIEVAVRSEVSDVTKAVTAELMKLQGEAKGGPVLPKDAKGRTVG